MANLADRSGDAGSNIVHGTGASSLAFTMPGNVMLDVESVVATIDNTAGGATTPTLVVRDSSGEVIATKRMGDTIPAGGTGTATFSLRNTDNAVSSSGGVTVESAEYSGSFVNIAPGASALLVWDSFDLGTALLDLSVPDTPTVLDAGLYIVNVTYACRTGGISFRGTFSLDSGGAAAATLGTTGDMSGLGSFGFVSLTIPYLIPAGGSLRSEVLNEGGIAADFYVNEANIVRVS